MIARRLARAGLVAAGLVHLVTYIPGVPGSSLLLLWIPGVVLHLGAMTGIFVLVWRAYRGRFNQEDLVRSFSGRAGCLSLLLIPYVAVMFVLVGTELETGTINFDSTRELQLGLRLFSAAWMLFLGGTWRVFRSAGVTKASEAHVD